MSKAASNTAHHRCDHASTISALVKRPGASMISALALAAAFLLASGVFAQEHSPEKHHGKRHHQHSEDAEIAALTTLRKGGNVLYFRHERTDVTRLDDERVDLDNCATQRNLSVAGIANSQQTGDYIRRLGIPIGEVFASPMCRCLETARYAFGRAQVLDALMGDWRAKGRSFDDVGRDLKTLLKANIKSETNVVFVAHFANIFNAFGLRLPEGDAAVLRLNDQGEVIVAGTIGAHRWGDLIRDTMPGDHKAMDTHRMDSHQHAQ